MKDDEIQYAKRYLENLLSRCRITGIRFLVYHTGFGFPCIILIDQERKTMLVRKTNSPYTHLKTNSYQEALKSYK